MRRRAAGFALISALFVIVVVSLVAAYMVQVNSGQLATSNLAVSSTRAYYAARAGMQVGVQRVLAGAACPGAFTVEGYQVSLRCDETIHADPSPRQVIQISAVATWGSPGEAEYVSREIHATVATPTP